MNTDETVAVNIPKRLKTKVDDCDINNQQFIIEAIEDSLEKRMCLFTEDTEEKIQEASNNNDMITFQQIYNTVEF